MLCLLNGSGVVASNQSRCDSWGEVVPGVFEHVVLLLSPCRAGRGRPGAKFLNDRCTKRGPAPSLLCYGWRGWFADQVLAVIGCIAPPVMEETAKGGPWIFSLIDARNRISKGMYGVWKWSFHHDHFLGQESFPLHYTPNGGGPSGGKLAINSPSAVNHGPCAKRISLG